jgi:DNA repair protein RecO (recombination protein O)
MEWTDTGIVLGTRRHGEANAILEVMTVAHGRHLGMVRGGAATRLRPVLQPGNTVIVTWRARLEEHLGQYTVEGIALRAASYLDRAHALYGVTHVAALCRLLPERDPHTAVFDALLGLVDDLDEPLWFGARLARFELQILAELGFGLDLSECAATGTTEDLAYVSPRSGRAVSRAAAGPWRDKLLPLPAFMAMPDSVEERPGVQEVAAAFALTGYFLERRVLEPRGSTMPDARQSFLTSVLGHAATAICRVSGR